MNSHCSLFTEARNLSWEKFGRVITFYHPGMFRYQGKCGKYPALSITGNYCELQCDHCRGKLLDSMILASTPEELLSMCRRLKRSGNKGVLITGGSLKNGSLPWEKFISHIKAVKEETGLFVSVHCGMLDFPIARKLKEAGVDQALIDVIGADEVLQKIFHLDGGICKVEKTLDSLKSAGIPIVPHIVVGLFYGKINGEYRAIEMLKKYQPEITVIVSFMPLSGTPMEHVRPPASTDIARIIATARIELPCSQIALGCARERGNQDIDLLALECGVNRMAIPSDEVILKAREYDLQVRWEEICCSVPNVL